MNRSKVINVVVGEVEGICLALLTGVIAVERFGTSDLAIK